MDVLKGLNYFIIYIYIKSTTCKTCKNLGKFLKEMFHYGENKYYHPFLVSFQASLISGMGIFVTVADISLSCRSAVLLAALPLMSLSHWFLSVVSVASLWQSSAFMLQEVAETSP